MKPVADSLVGYLDWCPTLFIVRRITTKPLPELSCSHLAPLFVDLFHLLPQTTSGAWRGHGSIPASTLGTIPRTYGSIGYELVSSLRDDCLTDTESVVHKLHSVAFLLLLVEDEMEVEEQHLFHLRRFMVSNEHDLLVKTVL